MLEPGCLARADPLLVSVIVPCRNEARWIDAFVSSVLAQRLEGLTIEILVADGCSDDGTRERLAHWAGSDSRIVLVDNPKKIVSTGLNAAIRAARGQVVVRMDVHTTYAPDYIARCVSVLAETGAVCVGGPWRPEGLGIVGEAIARAFESTFGSGGAKSRHREYSGPVDTVYLGTWHRDDLVRLGGFDETLVRNQDDELNLRITRDGGTVWQSPLIRSTYVPRASFGALFRQFFQYGYWKVAVIRKHRLPASFRHLVPFAFVVSVLGGALLAPIWPALGVLSFMVALTYFITALAYALRCRDKPRGPVGTLYVAVAFACMHAGYGLGFGCGLWDFILLRKGPQDYATRLTR